MEKYNLAIVGAGPAGMSAALNAHNDNLRFVLCESQEEGWFPRVSVDSHYTVDNYLGFNNISGSELIDKFRSNLANNGISVDRSCVQDVRQEEDMFSIDLGDRKAVAESIILCTGTKQRELELPGIDRFLGKSVFYYCASEGYQFVGKKVFVVGGRNTGAVTAVYLKNIGCDVEIIEKDPRLNCKDKYAQKIKDLSIPVRTSSQIVSLDGEEKRLREASIQGPKRLERVAAEGVFVCIGLLPNNDLARRLNVGLDEWGYVKVDNNMATNIPGIYAAGDITGNLKQIVVAAAQGSIAEYNANKFLRQKWKRE
jgi:thioredoxin reductase (NADPH)